MVMGVDPVKLAQVQRVTKYIRARVIVDTNHNTMTLQMMTDSEAAQTEIPNLLDQLAVGLGQQLSSFFGIEGELVKRE